MGRCRLVSGPIVAASVLIVVCGGARAFATGTADGAQNLSGIAGWGETWILTQNLDPAQDASIVSSFYPQSGRAPFTGNAPTTAPGDVAMLDLAQMSMLPDGAYAVRVDSDRQIGALVGIKWPATGASAFYNDAPASTELVVPLVMKDLGPMCSLVTIQNTDDTGTATVDVELYGEDGGAVPLVEHVYQVQPGTSWTLDVCTGDDYLPVPSGLRGWMRVKSGTDVAVQVMVDNEASELGVFGFHGVPRDRAASSLYAPLIDAAWSPSSGSSGGVTLSTGIAVVNPGQDPVDVTVTYRGMGGACDGQTVVHGGGPFRLAPSAQAMFTQLPGSLPIETGESGLPPGCRASATIEADGGEIVAVVVDETQDMSQTAAYNAMPLASVPHLIHLPMLSNDGGAAMAMLPRAAAPQRASRLTGMAAERVYVPQIRRASNGATTGLQVMNLGPDAARVTLRLSDGTGGWITACGADCVATIEPLTAHHWWIGDMAVLQDGTQGWAVIDSNHPLAVAAYEYSQDASVDLVMFEGIHRGADDSIAPTDPLPLVKRFAPIALK